MLTYPSTYCTHDQREGKKEFYSQISESKILANWTFAPPPQGQHTWGGEQVGVQWPVKKEDAAGSPRPLSLHPFWSWPFNLICQDEMVPILPIPWLEKTLCTGESRQSFSVSLNLQAHVQPLKQHSFKKLYKSKVTIQTQFIYFRKIFLAQEFRVYSPVSQAPRSYFKSPISPWKSKKN